MIPMPPTTKDTAPIPANKNVSPLVMLVTIFNASSCDLTAKSSSLIILCLCLN